MQLGGSKTKQSLGLLQMVEIRIWEMTKDFVLSIMPLQMVSRISLLEVNRDCMLLEYLSMKRIEINNA